MASAPTRCHEYQMTLFKQKLRRLLLGGSFLRKNIRQTNAIDRLGRQIARLAYPGIADPEFVAGLEPFELGFCSQYGEDGIILYLVDRIGVARRLVVEIGIEDGRECNSANLVLNFGWRAVQFEADEPFCRSAQAFFASRLGEGATECKTIHAFVTSENVNRLLEGAGISGEIDVFSLDVDGNDYWIWKALTACRPRIAVIEYNASFGVERSVTIPYDPQFVVGRDKAKPFYHGASLAALSKLSRSKGYVLVGCESSGVNAFFVHEDLAAAANLHEVDVATAFRVHARRCASVPHETQVARTSRYLLVDV